MKRGYKETEIGEIPEEWDIKPLEDIGTTYTGLSGKTKSDFGSGFPYVPFMNINRNSHVDENFFDYVMLSEGEVQNTVEYGDILFTTSSETPDEVGMSSVVLCKIPKLYLNSFSFGFRPNKSTNLFPKYSEYIFRGKKSREQIEFLGQGSTRYNISKNQLLKMYIPLPPLTEQKKIAEILSSVDESIRATQAVIEQAKVLKQGMLNQLLTKGIGHKKFKQSEIGEIPEEWEVKPLDSLVDKVGSGITPKGGSKVYLQEGIPLIRSQNVLMGKLDLSDVAYISDEQQELMISTKLLPNDVLLNITGASIGRSAVVPVSFREGNVNQHVCIIRPQHSVSSNYLMYFLCSSLGQKQIASFQAGGNREGLNFQQIRKFIIPLPKVNEQDIIVTSLQRIDSFIESNEDYAYGLEKMKSGLMQDLLTGKKRVVGKK